MTTESKTQSDFRTATESKKAPKAKIVMTRRFGGHPLLGERETTLTYRLEPSPHGTLVAVREEGFIGRSEAAYGNAENWEKVLGWLDGYLGSK